MRRASSGSRSARSSSEPFMSANSTVTCLRSPSSVPREVRIFSARCGGVYVSGEAKRTGAGARIGWPQPPQKRAPGSCTKPQRAHETWRAWPHATQKRWLGQVLRATARAGHRSPSSAAGSGSRGASPRRVSAAWRARSASAAVAGHALEQLVARLRPVVHRDHARELARARRPRTTPRAGRAPARRSGPPTRRRADRRARPRAASRPGSGPGPSRRRSPARDGRGRRRDRGAPGRGRPPARGESCARRPRGCRPAGGPARPDRAGPRGPSGP